MIRFFAITLVVVCAFSFWTSPCVGDSGTCYSAEELSQVKANLQSSLKPGEKGLLLWCVPRDNTRSIIWSTLAFEPESKTDNGEVKRIKRRMIADFRMVHKTLADIGGGCVKSPVMQIIVGR